LSEAPRPQGGACGARSVQVMRRREFSSYGILSQNEKVLCFVAPTYP